MQISYIGRATNCRSVDLSLRSQPIQPNIVKEQCTSGTNVINPNTQLCDTLQAGAKRCKLDIPLIPFCFRYVTRIAVIDHLGAVDRHLQVPGVALSAVEVQHQCRSAGLRPILPNSKRAFGL